MSFFHSSKILMVIPFNPWRKNLTALFNPWRKKIKKERNIVLMLQGEKNQPQTCVIHSLIQTSAFSSAENYSGPLAFHDLQYCTSKEIIPW